MKEALEVLFYLIFILIFGYVALRLWSHAIIRSFYSFKERLTDNKFKSKGD